MDSAELDRLLIEHLGDLDDGAKRLEMLQNTVAEAVDDLVEEWTKTKGWLKGDETWQTHKDVSVALRHWLTEKDEWLAWFQFDFGEGDDGEWSEEKDYFWLTRLCGVGRGQMGFRFVQKEFGKVPWKRFLNENRDRLAIPRFIHDDLPSFFLPVRIDKDVLAKGAENGDFSEALQPITEALDYIYEVSPRFEQMRQDMLKKQGS